MSDIVNKEGDFLDANLYQVSDIELLRKEVYFLVASGKKREATEKVVKLLKQYKTFFTIRSDIKEETWMYSEGIYIPEGKTYIKEFCRSALTELFSSHLVNEVIAKISSDTFINIDYFFNSSPKDKIPVLNGVLDLKTRLLEPFSPSYVFFVKINAVYDVNADCPNIKSFFSSMIKEEDLPAMQELFGYCLWKENFAEVSFLFRADGSNGKSKTLELMKNFLNPANCVSIPLHQLEGPNNFNVIELHNKLVNLAGELSKTALKETQMFKLLTGRDHVTANRKFLQPLSFVNFSKFIFSCNERPPTYDVSDGFFRRWIVFYFKTKFVDQEVYDNLENKEGYAVKDLDIVEKISSVEEFSGLLNWSLDGLHRLLQNKKFTNTKGTEETKDDWLKDSNNFVLFFEKYLCLDKSTQISKSDLRTVYVDYCDSKGFEPVIDKIINWYLSNKGVTIERKNREKQYNTEQERCWKGLKFQKGVVDIFGWSMYTGD